MNSPKITIELDTADREVYDSIYLAVEAMLDMLPLEHLTTGNWDSEEN